MMAAPLSHPRHWNNDLHVVLDFYKGNPQMAAPVIMDKTSDQTRSAPIQPYWNEIQNMQECDLFLEGMLLKSLESDARHPYVHYIVYNNQTPHGNRQVNSATSPAPGTISTGQNDGLIGMLASQGGYREMFTFVDHQTPLLPKRPQSANAAYLISSFKTLGCVKELDSLWSYWSGADLIVETIPPLLKLQRLTLHKIKYDTMYDAFAYVLMCELGEALTHRNRALEFVETLKDRQCGLCSLYSVEHSF